MAKPFYTRTIRRRDAVVFIGAAGAYFAVGSAAGGGALAELTTSSWAGSAEEFGWQMFELATGDTLVTPALIEGHAVNAVLDTGSAMSMVSTQLAKKLNLTGANEQIIRGNSGRASVTMVHGVAITLDGAQRTVPSAMIVDLTAVSAGFGRAIDLIVGLDMLVGRSLALDFSLNRLAFQPTGAFRGGDDWRALPLSIGANRELLVHGAIAGEPSVPLILDLGNATALTLSREFVDKHQLFANKRSSSAAVGGVEGIHVASAFTLAHADLGGLHVTDLPTLAVTEWLSTSAVGNIGLPLLSQFDLVIDVSAKTVWIRAPQQSHKELMLKDRSGLGVAAAASELTVVHVAVGSPAAKAGWKAGDRIIGVDGYSIDGAYTRGTVWRWRFGQAGNVIRLTMADLSRRVIVLADYY
jgi:hypothetical protein